MNKKLRLAVLIFLIGFIGVVSTLTMDIPLPEEMVKRIGELFTPLQFKLLSLINPTILLVIMVPIGTFLYEKVKFKMPVFESLVSKNSFPEARQIIKYGILGGLVSAVLISSFSLAFEPFLPAEFIELGEKFQPGPAVRLLYGGLTEEILIRFGLMTLIVWLIFIIYGKLNTLVYGIGIVLSAIIFGFGHLPIVFTLIGTPTTALFFYIILGNTVGGIVFGWLYWKKGLEAAMIAHIFTHLVMLAGEYFLKL